MLLNERSPLLTSIPIDFGISPDKSAWRLESDDKRSGIGRSRNGRFPVAIRSASLTQYVALCAPVDICSGLVGSPNELVKSGLRFRNPRPLLTLNLSHAPVDGDFAACHETGIIGREKEYRRCDFLGQSEPAHRSLADEIIFHLRGNVFEATSITDRPWRYCIHANLSIFELTGPCAGKGANRRLRCAVGT